MELSEQDLRAMIREAIDRHARTGRQSDPPASAPPARAALGGHASHGLLVVPAPGDSACVIEPAVRCDHCGYCKSLGH